MSLTEWEYNQGYKIMIVNKGLNLTAHPKLCLSLKGWMHEVHTSGFYMPPWVVILTYPLSEKVIKLVLLRLTQANLLKTNV